MHRRLFRMMNQILGDIPSIRAHLDDVVVTQKSLEEQMQHAQTVLKRISGVDLKLKIKKCSFAKKKDKTTMTHCIGRYKRSSSRENESSI